MGKKTKERESYCNQLGSLEVRGMKEKPGVFAYFVFLSFARVFKSLPSM